MARVWEHSLACQEGEDDSLHQSDALDRAINMGFRAKPETVYAKHFSFVEIVGTGSMFVNVSDGRSEFPSQPLRSDRYLLSACLGKDAHFVAMHVGPVTLWNHFNMAGCKPHLISRCCRAHCSAFSNSWRTASTCLIVCTLWPPLLSSMLKLVFRSL